MDNSSPLSELNQQKDFQCHICHKYFTRKFTLDMHLLIHDNVKPFPCPFCGKCFRQKGTLMRHKALHSINNLFHCSLCNRGFRQKNVFLYHLRHRHKVATETLDRRKYPMEDYQSIMDTLPSFVHADSTAITSSEKHLDAILFETLTNGTCDSSFADGSSVNNGQMLSDDCSNIGNTDDLLNGGISYKCSVCFMLFVDFDEYKRHVEDEHNNEEVLLDSKPILSSIHFPVNNVNESVSKSDATSNLSNANILPIPNSNLVTSSIEVDGSEKGNLCTSYEQDFLKEKLKINSLKIPVKNPSVNYSKSDGSNPKTFNSSSSKVNCDTFLSRSNLDLPLKSKNKTLCNVSNKMTNTATLNKIKTMPLNSGSQVNLVKSFSTRTDSHSEREVSFLGEKVPHDKCNSKSSYPRTLYKCERCDEVFKKKIAFEYHRQMHLNSRAFECGFCKSKFKSKQLLLSHTRSKHMKTFKCDSCSRTFNYHSIFTFHKKNCNRANLAGGFKNRFNLPLVDLDKLLDSDVSGIAGVIPICDNGVSNMPNIKFGIPIVSVEAMRNFSKDIFFNSLEIKGLLK